MAKKVRAELRPLRVRSGARYTCFGDGLCCTDVHGLGPITKKELVQLRTLDGDAGSYSDDFEDYMLHTAADGGCVFLLPDQRCRVHAEHGAEAKPDGCRRFPLGITGTPEGGRITTEHRCPCRTLGDRPVLDEASALPSVVDGKGRPYSDRDVTRIRLERGQKRKPFAAWTAIEGPVLAELAGGGRPEEVLEAEPFPKLKGSSWPAQAREFIRARDGSQFGVAIAWFGDTVLVLVDGKDPRPPGRPWAAAFDRAQARMSQEQDPEEMLRDWVADEIWSLKWAEDHPFDIKRAELATRLAVLRPIHARFVAEGLRPDRAMAEAIMIAELVGESDFWGEVMTRMRP